MKALNEILELIETRLGMKFLEGRWIETEGGIALARNSAIRTATELLNRPEEKEKLKVVKNTVRCLNAGINELQFIHGEILK